MAAFMFLLIGLHPDEISFMLEAEPDGSRVEGLEQLISTLALAIIAGPEGT